MMSHLASSSSKLTEGEGEAMGGGGRTPECCASGFPLSIAAPQLPSRATPVTDERDGARPRPANGADARDYATREASDANRERESVSGSPPAGLREDREGESGGWRKTDEVGLGFCTFACPYICKQLWAVGRGLMGLY